MDDSRIEQIIKQAVQAGLTAAEEREEHYHKMVERHEHLLYGNGREGLTTIVDRLNRAVTTAEGITSKVIATLVVAGVLGVLVLIVERGFFKP